MTDNRLKLFNARYSPNLGDGLLSECLERALVEHGADAHHTASVDLAARRGYGRGPSWRAPLLRSLTAAPPWLRRTALRPALRRQLRGVWAPHYAEAMEQCDGVVIGGGNLFTDVDLNFPTKLAAVLREAVRRKLPVAVHAVGVSREWGDEGRRLVQEAFDSVDLWHISVRDEPSRRHFRALFPDLVPVRVARDPALLTARYYPAPAVLAGSGLVGLGVTSAVAVRYHSQVRFADRELLDWYAGLYRRLAVKGHEIRLFTNGSPEDIGFGERLLARLPASAARLAVLEPKTPERLVGIIADCDRIAAFRLHALIAAWALGRPILGFRWDPKLDAFMQSVGCGDAVLSAIATPPAEAARRVHECTISPSDSERARVADDAFRDVGAAAAAFGCTPRADASHPLGGS